jgi:magnesium chelatase family protein
MLVKTYGSALYGIEARTITIEVDVSQGLHYFIVGLPDSAIKESLRRIESALKSNGWLMPRTKLVINLAPADIRKSGTAFDLPMAIGILGASGQLSPSSSSGIPLDESPPGHQPQRDFPALKRFMMMGELSLDGTLRPIRGVMAMAEQAYREGYKGLIIPKENALEASLSGSIPIYGVHHITEVVEILEGRYKPSGGSGFTGASGFLAGSGFSGASCSPTASGSSTASLEPGRLASGPEAHSYLDFSHVKGQQHVKRAMEIAAAGSHNILLIGPPGTGKTMLARLLPSILPPLTKAEAIETTKIYSITGKLPLGIPLVRERPFRSPHHTVSNIALVGGGPIPQPGEISLAHNGVLFLDELPEFSKTVLEVLRQPMEESKVTISRAAGTLDFPARFMLVGAMNPCPCGYHSHPHKECTCTSAHIQRYLGRISGPILDRIDLHLEVGPLDDETLVSTASPAPENSEVVRRRVFSARLLQAERLKDYIGIYANGHMNAALVQEHCTLAPESRKLLAKAMDKLHFSARAYDRINKVSRTIADLEGSMDIKPVHIAEALQYRCLDRPGWAG